MGREFIKILTINIHAYDIHKTTVTYGKNWDKIWEWVGKNILNLIYIKE